MYMSNDGLGKISFKKLKKRLMKSPFAPAQIKVMQLLRKKKKTPIQRTIAMPVAPPIYQAPQDAPFTAPMQYQPAIQAPVTQSQNYPPQAVDSSNKMPSYNESYNRSARDLPPDYFEMSTPEQPVVDDAEYEPEMYETENLPVVTTQEFEASNDAEYGWMEGLSEGTAWGNIFTGAASEILAQQRAKREAKSVALQQAELRKYAASPSTSGFGLKNMLIPAALAIGGYLIFSQLKKR